jgi:hypothetical protein
MLPAFALGTRSANRTRLRDYDGMTKRPDADERRVDRLRAQNPTSDAGTRIAVCTSVSLMTFIIARFLVTQYAVVVGGPSR